eukprot:scaffold15003_cov100-Isochrysis_galbana.AAC.5
MRGSNYGNWYDESYDDGDANLVSLEMDHRTEIGQGEAGQGELPVSARIRGVRHPPPPPWPFPPAAIVSAQLHAWRAAGGGGRAPFVVSSHFSVAARLARHSARNRKVADGVADWGGVGLEAEVTAEAAAKGMAAKAAAEGMAAEAAQGEAAVLAQAVAVASAVAGGAALRVPSARAVGGVAGRSGSPRAVFPARHAAEEAMLYGEHAGEPADTAGGHAAVPADTVGGHAAQPERGYVGRAPGGSRDALWGEAKGRRAVAAVVTDTPPAPPPVASHALRLRVMMERYRGFRTFGARPLPGTGVAVGVGKRLECRGLEVQPSYGGGDVLCNDATGSAACDLPPPFTRHAYHLALPPS